MGRWSTVIGMLASIGTAYLVMHAASIMDYVQALFSFFIAPLLGTILLGMFWKRATAAGGFWGLLAGTGVSVGLFAWVKLDPEALSRVAFSIHAKAMAEDMYRALWSFATCALVTVIVSYMTKPKTVVELQGLVYGQTAIPHEGPVPFYKNHWFWAGVVFVGFIVLNVIFW